MDSKGVGWLRRPPKALLGVCWVGGSLGGLWGAWVLGQGLGVPGGQEVVVGVTVPGPGHMTTRLPCKQGHQPGRGAERVGQRSLDAWVPRGGLGDPSLGDG